MVGEPQVALQIETEQLTVHLHGVSLLTPQGFGSLFFLFLMSPQKRVTLGQVQMCLSWAQLNPRSRSLRIKCIPISPGAASTRKPAGVDCTNEQLVCSSWPHCMHCAFSSLYAAFFVGSPLKSQRELLRRPASLLCFRVGPGKTHCSMIQSISKAMWKNGVFHTWETSPRLKIQRIPTLVSLESADSQHQF